MNMTLIKHTKETCPDEQGKKEYSKRWQWWHQTLVGDLGIKKELYNNGSAVNVSNNEHDGKATKDKRTCKD